MRLLEQSNATTIVAGPFLNPTDGVTPVTGLPDQSTNALLFKAGAPVSFTATSWTDIGDGYYAVGLSGPHTNTTGHWRLAFSLPATYVPVWEDAMILPASSYQTIVLGSAPWTVIADVEQWHGANVVTPTTPGLPEVDLSSVTALLNLQGAFQVDLQINDQSSVGVPNFSVSIFDSTNTVYLGTVTTDSSGHATFNRNSGTYKLRPVKAGYTITPTPVTLVVTANTTLTLTANVFVPPAPPGPNLCVLFGTVANSDGSPLVGSKVVMRNLVPFFNNDRIMSGQQESVLTDSNGFFSLAQVQGTKIRLEIQDAGVVVNLTVPAQSSQDLTTLLASVDMDEPE